MIDKSVTYKSYIVGLAISLALTLASFATVIFKVFPPVGIYTTIAMLAVVQILVQVVYFLHIGHEEGTKWNLLSLIFSIIIVFIVVAGSMWVMYNMNIHMIH